MLPACSTAGDERVGQQQPELRMLPADERLGAVDLAASTDRASAESTGAARCRAARAESRRRSASAAANGRLGPGDRRLPSRGARAPRCARSTRAGKARRRPGCARDSTRRRPSLAARCWRSTTRTPARSASAWNSIHSTASRASRPGKADDELVAAQVAEHFRSRRDALRSAAAASLMTSSPARWPSDETMPLKRSSAEAHDGQLLVALDGVAQQTDDELAVRQPRQAVVMRLMEDAPLAIRDGLLHRVEAAGELAELVGRRGC